ncbi:hypothetical protein [Turneriella parva]|uniref:Uncharacterized protein n=1 Tax=Turneriella parva (strain ATCC BAA-1111 / DSM 21527 / NCTC 11395 / H) TaxID=869212 RepID=I4B692_TURPD|nr:hypothetical protein [Turneriella parva]AFM12799.1 hypothetical protein Turpa_2153 [Turneriella parva DSM 21527]
MKFMITVLGLFIFAGVLGAQAVEKKCTLAGTWVSQGKAKGKLLWKVKVNWSQGEGNNGHGFGIANNGTNKDSFGAFKLEGGCSEGFCTFDQTYLSGKFKNRVYKYTTGYETLAPFKISGDYQRVEGDNNVAEGKFTLDNMTCGK